MAFAAVVRARKRQDLEIAVGHRAAKVLLGEPHVERGIGAHDGRHHDRRVGGQRRRALLDVMAKPRQQGRYFAGGRGNFGIDGVAIGRLVGEGDAQPAGIAADFLEEGPLRRRRDIRARRFGSMDRVQHRRAVAHADAHDMAAGKPAPAFATIGTERIARAGRFQSEHAGGRSRNAYRAAAVARMRDGRMRAATAAAAPPEEPPEECARFQGFRVGPCRRDSVVGIKPNSGLEVLPKIVTPASRKRWVRVPV